MGPKRELKFALESFWDKKSCAEDLQKVAADLRSSIWKQMSDDGIKYIPSNTFSYYDQVLDATSMLGVVPPRYTWNGGEIGFDTYFSMARGNASVPAMEMTKWFDTNYHFIIPELGPDVNFSYESHKAVDEYKEANAEVISELKVADASWIQFDEPTVVLDLYSHQLQAFTAAYADLESTLSGLNVLIETYSFDLTAEVYKTLIGLKGVTAYGLDLIRGTHTVDLVKSSFPKGKYLFAGVVDGRNIWANDLASSLYTLKELEAVVGKDNLVVSTSCSLLHTAVDLVNETKLDDEIKSWLAFAAQKVVEVNALAKAFVAQKVVENFFSANTVSQASRKSSPRVTNEAVQKAATALKASDHRRATNVSARLDAQQKKLNLPILPTTTIGSFPQTLELRRVRREFKGKKISEDDYVKAIKEEIKKVVDLQEDLDIDVLPPIIYGDVSRPNPMTVFWSSTAQGMIARPIKGMLTGPVTILNWSFVRNDQPRITNCDVQDTTQIHTHMCYSNFNDIIHSIIDMDADVITIENSRSDEKLLSVFREGVKYGAGISPGVYGIHSPRIPSSEEIADRINKMLTVLETNVLWVNPDCGLKTRKYAEVKPALSNMVAAAKLLRTQLASAK
ncbi:5-methyltetrahydropteroyltriglutamate--homocysteine methyltransferase 2 [Hibiscus syriacus]|uniref:5-methyltetrahydropteroyltriglutamate--homocysteine S-methyltransferase n=1 Tax=Hibiscus syriacus TaxID=106335 RepID=A0A6A3AXL2_HIBSY|nr:5-methyltetrahydropteroyltriglutamate--homocysteine methyltransferase 2 [Hibiscus syriacus]